MELSSLQALFDHPGPWASVYLDTSRASQDAEHRIELRARAVAADLESRGAGKATCGAVLDALVHGRASGAPPGRALFATDGGIVLDLPLTAAPPVPDTRWGALPHMSPLLGFSRDRPTVLLARIDRVGARFELLRSLGREIAGEVRGRERPVHRTGRNAWSERHFQLRVENTWEHNAGLVAEELGRIWPGSNADLLVLAGEPRMRRSVEERLPEPLREAAVGTGREPSAGEMAEIRERWRRERLDAALDRFHAARGRPGDHRGAGAEPGPAAEGVPSVVRAARQDQVDTLLIRPGAPDGDREVWIGPEPHQVAVQRKEVLAMGVAEPRAAHADDALLRCGAVSDANALTLGEDTTDVGPAGGVGAVLRWSDSAA